MLPLTNWLTAKYVLTKPKKFGLLRCQDDREGMAEEALPGS